jgi:hypothetical protein
MFLYLLLLLLVGFGVHLIRETDRSRQRGAELLLRWVLVGYCGLPMVIVSVWLLVDPAPVLARFGFEAAGPLVAFFGWAYLGMALAGVAAAFGAPASLLGPAIVWSVFFLGATGIHLHAGHGGGHGSMVHILGSHLFISALLWTGLAAGGAVSEPT